MHAFSTLAIALLLPLSVLAHPASDRRHPLTNRNILHIRAGAPISNDTLSAMASQESADQASTQSQAQETSVIQTTSAAVTASETQQQQTSIVVTSVVQQSSVIVQSSSSSSDTDAAVTASVTVPTDSVTQATTSIVQQTSSTMLPTTISQQLPSTSTAIVTRSVPTLVTSSTSHKISTASASSTLAADSSTSTSSHGISKTVLIVIIVVASCVGLAGVGWTLFRKWKLKPSGRFDEKMRPMTFGPGSGGADNFLEKTLGRTNDPNRESIVADIPSHDFAATNGESGMAGYGAGQVAGYGAAYDNQTYHQDPHAHAQQYAESEYEQQYQQQQYGYSQDGYAYGQTYDQEQQQQYQHHAASYGQNGPYEGTGSFDNHNVVNSGRYQELERGNSLERQGSGSQGHGQGGGNGMNMPDPTNYLGRPTAMGVDGPYAQATNYRGY